MSELAWAPNAPAADTPALLTAALVCLRAVLEDLDIPTPQRVLSSRLDWPNPTQASSTLTFDGVQVTATTASSDLDDWDCWSTALLEHIATLRPRNFLVDTRALPETA